MSGPTVVVDAVSPTPTDEEAVAIAAALAWTWPRPVASIDAPPRGRTTDWRFSGRWWNNHPLTRRPRP